MLRNISNRKTNNCTHWHKFCTTQIYYICLLLHVLHVQGHLEGRTYKHKKLLKFYHRYTTLSGQLTILLILKFLWMSFRHWNIPYLYVGKNCTMQQVGWLNPLNPELNPICYLLALLGAHHFLHFSRIKVKLLTFRILMSYIYIWSTHSWCF